MSLTITNEDCMELLARTPDKYFELAIVDPQYGIGENGSKNKSRRGWGANDYIAFEGNDDEPMPPLYFQELQRVSNNQIIWGANHFIENIPNANSPCWILWDKCNGASDFADFEMAYTSFQTAARKFSFMWAGSFQGKSIAEGYIQQGNKALNEKRIHPTQKPVALYKWLLNKYAKPGDKILDTHLGGGSIAIACHEYGFDLTACELSPYYYAAAIKRIEGHCSQLKLFTP